ncbi:MAG: peptidoglycan-associated lipoprotein Pal [Desulfobacula sp.]|nr:peptidoglycan-associated lipoprotein Pal [Desulfobacula sp.]
MKNRMWINLVMAILVAGLFLTVSCAKKQIVESGTIENQAQVEAGAKVKAMTDAQAEAERIKQQKLDDQMAAQKALLASKASADKKRFGNQDVHFQYDSAELSPMAKMLLKEKAAWLKANYTVAVTIEGHCDERGTTNYNLALGERRAATVKSYLINLGVSASRMNIISFGEEQPKDFSKTESAFRKNRRAHFSID